MPSWLNQLPRWLVWEIAIPLTILNLWLLSLVFDRFESLLTTLTVAAILSFLLDYPIRFLQQKGIKRSLALLGIVLLALLAIGAFTVVISPMLFSQLGELTDRLPDWIESSDQQFETIDSWLIAQQISFNFSGLSNQVKTLLPNELTMLPEQILSSLLELADSLLTVLLTIVLTLYFLLYGEEFWHGLLPLFPDHLGSRVQQVARQQFQNYFVGQATIAGLMALLLTIAFGLLKIPFWLVFGLGIGVMVLIPFGDFIGMAVVTLIVSFKSVWLGAEVLAICLIVDQTIDNAISPRLIGDLVGLNPIWVVISLLIGAQIGGIVGLLTAVPLAGTIKILFGLWKTNESDLSNKTDAIEPVSSE